MRRSLLFALLLVAALEQSGSAQADDLSLKPRHGMLLLVNGQTIEGTITASGDRYDVTLNDGEIHIKRSQVAYLGRDLQDCYAHKRAGIEVGRVQDHLDLAEWCLRHVLRDEAAAELVEAKAADPKHPKIRLLETRLKLDLENAQTREPAKPAEKAAPTESLDVALRNLPAGSVETFTNNIQPLLLNYCTKSGCHGTQTTNGLRLERIPPNRHAGRKPTQRNLTAALALVDRAQPQESKLLKTPIRPHGAATAPVFTDREQSQYKQLVQWVYLVAGSKQQTAAAPTLEERSAPLRQTVPGPLQPPVSTEKDGTLPTKDASEVKAATWSDAFPDQGGVLGEPAAGQPGRAAHSRTPAIPGTFTPKDPFDPEIFNRRFFGG